jgi:hypothetical protein
MLRVKSSVELDSPDRILRDDLLLQLASSGLGVDTIKDRVALFQGRVRERSSGDSRSISLILHDTSNIHTQ